MDGLRVRRYGRRRSRRRWSAALRRRTATLRLTHRQRVVVMSMARCMRWTFAAILQLAELIQDAVAFEALAVADQRFTYSLVLEADKAEAVLSALLIEMASNRQCSKVSVFGFEVSADDFFGDERL